MRNIILTNIFLLSFFCLAQNNCSGVGPEDSVAPADWQEHGITENMDYPPLSKDKQKCLTCDSTTSQHFKNDQEKAIAALRNHLEKLPIPCDHNTKTTHSDGPCTRVSIEFSPKTKTSDASKGQRILIMDHGLILLSILRYHERVLDVLDFENDQGTLQTTSRKVITSKIIKDVYHDLIGQEFKHLPATLFSPIAGSGVGELKILQPYNAVLSDGKTEVREMAGAGHGVMILNKLMDYNPNAEFVIVDEPKGMTQLERYGLDLCRSHIDPSILSTYKNFTIHTSNVLIDTIKKYDIDFISSSTSVSLNQWAQFLARHCGTEFPVSNIAKQLYAIDTQQFEMPLNTLPGVIVVQAIHNTVDFTQQTARLSHSDCMSYPNRVKVGVFGASDSGVPIEGNTNSSLLPNRSGNLLPCIDIAVNVGRSEGDNIDNATDPVVWHDCNAASQCCTHWSPYFGIGTGGRLNGMTFSTSYAVPIALSYLIYLKKTLPQDSSTAEIISMATGNGKNFIKDPIRHRQIEVYRLGHLDP